MTETTNEPTAEPAEAAEAFVKPDPGVDLRALLRQRVETRARRTHRQWFCFDVQIASALRDATREFVEVAATEYVANQEASKTSRKWSASPRTAILGERVETLKEQSRQTGAQAVFHNLTSDELEAARDAARAAGGSEFDFGKAVLAAAFMLWETIDGTPIPLDVLGAGELDLLLDPDVVDEGEWKPLADKIIGESVNPVDRPTSPQS